MQPITRDAFEDLVRRAVAELPESILERIDNVEFAVEDVAEPDDHRRTGTPRSRTLLGVYRGVPLTARGHGYHLALPDRIAIFQSPLERMARDEAHLEALVRRTVRHEIAHYFGITDGRLHELGAY
ncbi:MAG: hypothetical protein GEU80_03920 [Dehalococcoidia bacterium]|nr:hypothetical protein [Dehalococcoidia bacterium]